MTAFADFGIKAVESKALLGEKLKIEKVFNTPVEVLDFRIEPSKVTKGNCLYLQIEYKGELRVIFTGSVVLLDAIVKVPKFPFTTTIVKENERYEFT